MFREPPKKTAARADTIDALRAQIEERLRKRIDSRVKKLRVVSREELQRRDTRQEEIRAELEEIRVEALRIEREGGASGQHRRDDVLRLHAEWRELRRTPDRSLIQSALATEGLTPRAIVLPGGAGYKPMRRGRRALGTFNPTMGSVQLADMEDDQILHVTIHEELHGVASYGLTRSRYTPAAIALEEATVESMAIGMSGKSGGGGIGWSAYQATIEKVHAELRTVLGADDRPFARAVHAASSPTEVREVVAELGRRMREGPISAVDYVDHVIASVPGITEAEATHLRQRFADLQLVIMEDE